MSENEKKVVEAEATEVNNEPVEATEVKEQPVEAKPEEVKKPEVDKGSPDTTFKDVVKAGKAFGKAVWGLKWVRVTTGAVAAIAATGLAIVAVGKYQENKQIAAEAERRLLSGGDFGDDGISKVDIPATDVETVNVQTVDLPVVDIETAE